MNIFFVDDEALTLQFLQKILDWESLNIKITGTATNGRDALIKIKNEIPQIVITDIKMPVMDGVLLIEEIRKFNSSIKIIVLSAYSDFEYARKVFSSGISGYLVKPIDEEKLLNLVTKTITELKKESQEQENNSFTSTLAIETLIWSQINRPDKNEDFYEKINKVNSVVPNLSHFQLLSLTFSESSVTREDIIKRFPIKTFYLIRTTSNKWLVLLETKIGSSDVSTIKRCLSHNSNVTFHISVSAVHRTPSELPQAYTETEDLNSLYYFEGDSSYVFYRERPNVITGDEVKLSDSVKDYYTILKNETYEKLTAYIDVLNNRLIKKYESDIPGYQNFWTLFIVLLKSKLNKQENHMYLPEKLRNFNSKTLKRFNDSEQILIFIYDITKEIFKTPASVSGDSGFSQIKDIKDYVYDHFPEKLSLEFIAEHFNMSKNYLCRIFKETAGCTLWDYLTMIRVEHAKSLLENSRYTTAEIALQVGYDNQGYFSSVFKKRTGISPKQYKDRINSRGPQL